LRRYSPWPHFVVTCTIRTTPAIIRAQQGSTEEAIGLHRDVISIDDTDARAHLNLGFLLIASGERKEGQRELDRAVELDPSLASQIPGGEPVAGEATGSS
jgi:Flp pilus assembly protein TadD